MKECAAFKVSSRQGVLWYFQVYVGLAHLFGYKIFNFNIFLGFSDKYKFFGVIRFCGYFFFLGGGGGGVVTNWTILGVISMNLSVFS